MKAPARPEMMLPKPRRRKPMKVSHGAMMPSLFL